MSTTISTSKTPARISPSTDMSTTKTPTPRISATEIPSTEDMILETPTSQSSVSKMSTPASLSGKQPISAMSNTETPTGTQSIPENSTSKALTRNLSSTETPNYACTVMPSICKETFSKVNLWMKHELTPDHHFLLCQTEWLCAHQATEERPLPLPRNDQQIIGGCNLAFNMPDGLSKHWRDSNETGLVTEFMIGKGVQRFWCGFCQKVHLIGLSGHYNWDKGRFDHIRKHFEGLPGQPETKWKIEQWEDYKNVDDAEWKDLPPQEWK